MLNAFKDKLICNRIRWYGCVLKMFDVVVIPKKVLSMEMKQRVREKHRGQNSISNITSLLI
jgi:hypothetical protein